MWSSDATEWAMEGFLLGLNECEESERGDSNMCHNGAAVPLYA